MDSDSVLPSAGEREELWYCILNDGLSYGRKANGLGVELLGGIMEFSDGQISTELCPSSWRARERPTHDVRYAVAAAKV